MLSTARSITLARAQRREQVSINVFAYGILLIGGVFGMLFAM